jgi:hypothetical protein
MAPQRIDPAPFWRMQFFGLNEIDNMPRTEQPFLIKGDI